MEVQTTGARQPIRLRSPLARAVVPVLAGIGVIVAIGLFTWGMAAYITHGGGTPSETLAPTQFQVGSTQNAANIVAEDGPIMFPGLLTTTGERTFILDHEGDDPATGWKVYAALSGRTRCLVHGRAGRRHEHVHRLRRQPRSTSPTSLPHQPGVNPIVEGGGRTLLLDLRGVTETSVPT